LRILFVGGSSFTGYYFVRRLAEAGHEVHVTFTGNLDGYSGLRGRRVEDLLKVSIVHWGVKFGDQKFTELLRRGFNTLAIHFAYMEEYRSSSFDLMKALRINTNNIEGISKEFALSGGRRIVYTGTVFEPNEGVSEDPARAFSPYGLSKSITSEIVSYWAGINKLQFSKFIISNPFGPLEDAKFTRYLIETWIKKEEVVVKTPRYIRDNIHVTILAENYCRFIESEDDRAAPSGFAESQGDFVKRCAREIGGRTGLECNFIELEQTVFTEPLIRVNPGTSYIKDHTKLESLAWDSIAWNYV
jgi:UDP-glucose 4-epimerase